METQYIKISETEFKKVVPIEKVATLDDLVNLRASALARKIKEEETIAALDIEIAAVRLVGVKTSDEVVVETTENDPDPDEENS
jgi:hypothetical protein